jgi:hypothetical protein
MNTHADKTAKITSKAIANQVSKAKTYQQIANNRFGIIQRAITRDLNKDMLNVAGETHHAASREEDRELISRYGLTPDDYYQEHELGTTGVNATQVQKAGGGHPSADPALLRALQAATLMQKDVSKLKDNIGRFNGLKNAQATAQGDKWRLFDIEQRLPEETGSAMGLIFKLIDTVKNAIPTQLVNYNQVNMGGQAVREIDIASRVIHEKVKSIRIMCTKQNQAYLTALASLLQSLHQGQAIANAPGLLQVVETFGDSIMLDILQIVDQKGINLDQLTPESRDTHSKVVATRSFYMHTAANALAGQNKKGLWKIGNDHANDIIRNYAGPQINYNLIPGDAYTELMQKHGLGRNIVYKQVKDR